MVVQSINSIAQSVKNKIFTYSTGLISSIKKRNCIQMGKHLSLSHDALYRVLGLEKEGIDAIFTALFHMMLKLTNAEKGWLIVDDTLISKAFSNLLPGIDYLHDSSTGQTTKGLSMVVIAWTNGSITIPINFTFWFSKNVFTDGYKTKIELAQELINQLYGMVDFKGVLLDGLYASKAMMEFLNFRNIKFTMKMPSNRIIELPNGEKIKIRDIKELKPLRNARSRTIEAIWNDLKVFLTSELRTNKRGEKSLVFFVSNYDASSKDHVAAYKLRWKIEMFFRTAKQSLGLQECSSRCLTKQTMHIYLVFLSYAFLQHELSQKSCDSVEDIIKIFQDSKSKSYNYSIRRLDQFFQAFA